MRSTPPSSSAGPPPREPARSSLAVVARGGRRGRGAGGAGVRRRPTSWSRPWRCCCPGALPAAVLVGLLPHDDVGGVARPRCGQPGGLPAHHRRPHPGHRARDGRGGRGPAAHPHHHRGRRAARRGRRGLVTLDGTDHSRQPGPGRAGQRLHRDGCGARRAPAGRAVPRRHRGRPPWDAVEHLRGRDRARPGHARDRRRVRHR